MEGEIVLLIGSNDQPSENGFSPVNLPETHEPARQHKRSVHILMLRMMSVLTQVDGVR